MKCNCLNLLHQNLPKINGNKTTKCKGKQERIQVTTCNWWFQKTQTCCSAHGHSAVSPGFVKLKTKTPSIMNWLSLTVLKYSMIVLKSVGLH